MRVRDLAYETVRALDANRGRSFLTILGVVIGIAAVIAMMALIGGVRNSMMSSMGLSQARLVIISYYGTRDMTLDDVELMQADLASDYEVLSPMLYASAEVSAEGNTVKNGSFTGAEPDYAQIMGMNLVQGRFFTQEEEDEGHLVVVLDQVGVKKLFGSASADAVGKSVRINGAAYAVVGVAESDASMGGDYASFYLPLSTCARRISGSGSAISQVNGLAWEDLDMDAVAQDTTSWMQKRFHVDDDEVEEGIWVQTMDSIIREVNSVMSSFQMLMTSVAAISLVVGGIGIMNMMLTNVTERIREIGLRKALGARRRDITRQFLLESVCLTLAGGALGILLGYGGAFALAGLTGDMFSSFGASSGITPSIDPNSVLTVAAICVGIGIAFGYYPARRAARLDPVESLRFQ